MEAVTTERFIKAITEEFPRKRILVLGDAMVDEYIYGSVSRISPEAPIPVLAFGERKLVGGGAANVVENILSLGSSAILLCAVGQDEYGTWLQNEMGKNGSEPGGCIVESGRLTTLKQRFATHQQQILRVDREISNDITYDTQKQMLKYLETATVDAVIFSDYKKGVLSNADFVRRLIKLCEKRGILTAVDTKSENVSYFSGASFIKPNQTELEHSVGIHITDEESLETAGRTYLTQSGAKMLVLTRGEKGISIFTDGTQRRDYPSRAAQVYDVSGAGDTVISAITLAFSSGLSIDESAILSNLAAGIVVSKRGTSTVSVDELLENVNECR